MIYFKMMGGLGNQMFQYATLKSLMLENNQKGVIEIKNISGIKKRSHNVFTLDKFNIDSKIKIINKKYSIKNSFNFFVYCFYCIFFQKRKNGIIFEKKIQPFINKFGCYCIPDGYLKINKISNKNNYVIGYFQALKYFQKYEKEIRNDLQVKENVMQQNKEIFKNIKKDISVCVHIRRGDYIGTDYDVCSIVYYKEAMQRMKNNIPNCKFYFFSNDINWVKENIKGDNIVYVDKNNPNYEELRLMYSCKHFIMSNSSFSWWAQFLSSNSKKIVYAPSKWMKNDTDFSEIYDDRWNLL